MPCERSLLGRISSRCAAKRRAENGSTQLEQLKTVETEDLTRWCEKPESSQAVFATPVWTHQLEFIRQRGWESRGRKWGETTEEHPRGSRGRTMTASRLETDRAYRGCVSPWLPMKQKSLIPSTLKNENSSTADLEQFLQSQRFLFRWLRLGIT